MFDVNDLRKQIKNLEKDDILKLIGVEERRTGAEVFFTGLGLFTAGVLVGAAGALLLTPKTGAQLRQDLRTRITPGAEQPIGTQLGGTPASTPRQI